MPDSLKVVVESYFFTECSSNEKCFYFIFVSLKMLTQKFSKIKVLHSISCRTETVYQFHSTNSTGPEMNFQELFICNPSQESKSKSGKSILIFWTFRTRGDKKFAGMESYVGTKSSVCKI